MIIIPNAVSGQLVDIESEALNYKGYTLNKYYFDWYYEAIRADIFLDGNWVGDVSGYNISELKSEFLKSVDKRLGLRA